MVIISVFHFVLLVGFVLCSYYFILVWICVNFIVNRESLERQWDQCMINQVNPGDFPGQCYLQVCDASTTSRTLTSWLQKNICDKTVKGNGTVFKNETSPSYLKGWWVILFHINHCIYESKFGAKNHCLYFLKGKICLCWQDDLLLEFMCLLINSPYCSRKYFVWFTPWNGHFKNLRPINWLIIDYNSNSKP